MFKAIFEVQLPIPTSVNKAYVPHKKGKHKSDDYKVWARDAGWLLKSQVRNIQPLTGRLIAIYKYQFPDKRRRDVANFEKVLSDFLDTHNVFNDDSQIDLNIALRLPPNKLSPCVFIKIIDVGEFIPDQVKISYSGEAVA